MSDQTVMYVTVNAELLWPPMQTDMLSSNTPCDALNKLDDNLHACI